jgi:hypothetical protein
MDLVKLSVVTCGIAWTITYVALVYRGFKDKSYGMPLVPLALNFAWEVMFSMVYPPHSAGIVNIVFNSIWMICDIGIVTTFFLYGYKYFEQYYKITKSNWLIFSILAFAFSFGIMFYGGSFFGQFNLYFKNDTFEGAKFIALIQNAVISICMVLMYLQRRNSDGQSFTIAWSKWLGTSMTVGLSYIYTHQTEQFQFIAFFVLATFIFDTYYMYLIYNQLKKEGINPWTRL